jgi:hypothetical protein
MTKNESTDTVAFMTLCIRNPWKMFFSSMLLSTEIGERGGIGKSSSLFTHMLTPEGRAHGVSMTQRHPSDCEEPQAVYAVKLARFLLRVENLLQVGVDREGDEDLNKFG